MSRKTLQRLHRRGHKFYFRAVVPKRWQVAVKAFEIKFSLHTEDRTIANIRCRSLSNAFDLFFREENLAQIPLERINEAARTAAVAWLKPFPPGPVWYCPLSVSPGRGSAATVHTWSTLNEPTTTIEPGLVIRDS